MWAYTCTTFRGHYPVGSAAVVVAVSRRAAAAALEEALAKIGLAQIISWKEMEELDMNTANVRILRDGDY